VLPKSFRDDREVNGRRKRHRSVITTGKKLLPDLDGRSPWIRRCRDIIDAHVTDLGGPANTSSAERSIVRRAAVLTTQLEIMEGKFAACEGDVAPHELELYQRGAGQLRRLLESVGLERRPREITPSLDEYLSLKADRDDTSRNEAAE
jgi:hypothetical protein